MLLKCGSLEMYPSACADRRSLMNRRPENGDVLLSSTGTGTLGKACVYDSNWPAIADGHVTVIRADQGKVNPYYLADYLRTGGGAIQIERLYTGATGLIELQPEEVDQVLV